MARLQLNKSSLAREAKNLQTYQRFLPSLDLKRTQLMAECHRAEQYVDERRKQIIDLNAQVGRELTMLANYEIDLAGLVTLKQVNLGAENHMGIRLPTLESLVIETQTYALLAKPHWVDNAVVHLRTMLENRIQKQVAEQRLLLLRKALKTVTQRVNLFEKVLIPKTQHNIKRIKVYLSDEQMAAVVRSKISKNKHKNIETI